MFIMYVVIAVGMSGSNNDLKPTCKRKDRPTMKCRAKCCRKKTIQVEIPGEQEKLFLVGTPKQQLRNWRNRQN